MFPERHPHRHHHHGRHRPHPHPHPHSHHEHHHRRDHSLLEHATFGYEPHPHHSERNFPQHTERSHPPPFHTLFPHPPPMNLYPRGEPSHGKGEFLQIDVFHRDVEIPMAEMIAMPESYFYVHRNQTVAVPFPPASGHCIFHIVEIPNYTPYFEAIIDGRIIVLENLPNEVSRIVVGIEVDSSEVIPLAVAEPIKEPSRL